MEIVGSSYEIIHSKSKIEFITSYHYKGSKFNSPNDLVYNQKVNFILLILHTLLKKEKIQKRNRISGSFSPRGNGKVELVSKELERPNGIVLSPDEKTLYIANSHGPTIWVSYPSKTV